MGFPWSSDPPPWWHSPFEATQLTSDEIVAFVTALLALLSLLAALLHSIFLWTIRLPCLRSYLLSWEVHAEVAAMNQSVRRAFAVANQVPSAAAAAARPRSPPGRGGKGRGGGGKGGSLVPRVAGLGSRGGREAPTTSMGDYAPVLILAEAKAETSKLDDRRKVRPSTIEVTSAARARGVRGGVAGGRGVRVDKKGRATLVYPGDGVYEGEYKDGKKEGKGKFWYVEGTVYDGSWRNDEKHGAGRETYADGAIYEGRFEAGSRHGLGTLTYANNDVYEGEWVEDVKHGDGTFRWMAGTVYEGQFADGVMHGKGTYHFSDGCTYQGEYADGKRNGRGVYRFLDGSFFEGEYRDGIVEGRGTFTFADGSAEVGRWQDGQPVGEATRFSPDHKNAWRLFDGQVTGPVSLDLADVIAQMAFRPKAARLARAVRDQLQMVHMEEERRKFANASGSPMSTGRGASARSRSLSPLGDRPPWQGPMDRMKASSPISNLDAAALAGGARSQHSASPGGSGVSPGRYPVSPPGMGTAGINGGFPTFASIVSSPKAGRGASPARPASNAPRKELLSIFSPKRRSPGGGASPPPGTGMYMA